MSDDPLHPMERAALDTWREEQAARGEPPECSCGLAEGHGGACASRVPRGKPVRLMAHLPPSTEWVEMGRYRWIWTAAWAARNLLAGHPFGAVEIQVRPVFVDDKD